MTADDGYADVRDDELYYFHYEMAECRARNCWKVSRESYGPAGKL